MKRSCLASALLFFLLIGCEKVEGQPIDIRSELKTEPAPQGQAAPDIRVEGRNLLLRAPITLPDPCHQVTEKTKVEGTEIVVKLGIEAPPADSFCIQVLKAVLAKVTIFDLPRGAYTLTLETPAQTIRETVRID